LLSRDAPFDFHNTPLKRSNDSLKDRDDVLRYRGAPLSFRDGPFDEHNASVQRSNGPLEYCKEALRHRGASMSIRAGPFDLHDVTSEKSNGPLEHSAGTAQQADPRRRSSPIPSTSIMPR